MKGTGQEKEGKDDPQGSSVIILSGVDSDKDHLESVGWKYTIKFSDIEYFLIINNYKKVI